MIFGKHFVVNCYNCKGNLADVNRLKEVVLKAVKKANMKLIDLMVKEVKGKKGGVSVIALVNESHISIHTWKYYNFATVDVYTCGKDSKPEEALKTILKYLKPKNKVLLYIDRNSELK